eukprot:CAMPEP_0170494380 /NCGR_PEP_ID=MMETSP0208-20121228/14609_1 /TAXON_ID=197538 /ORGANISM="Strombidium inclinatum, Strain S3" /LENGTH=138 /DNA_ID=CAMNT_0010770433 /DNA_START=847 /DNA_END=1263 /DNA_ORIENTATION=+
MPFHQDDVYISYLPLAHSYEQCNISLTFIYGTQCGFYAGDPNTLLDDLKTLKPTYFPSVPRVFNKIYSKLSEGIASQTGFKKWLIDSAFASKISNFIAGKGVTHPIYDFLVFKKIKAMLGGKVRIMTSASAPIAADIL